jgi:hypothetical protein
MTNAGLRVAAWLSLAYLAAKIVATYYVLMFPPGRVTVPLAELSALSAWDTAAFVVAALAHAKAGWVREFHSWVRSTLAPMVRGLDGRADAAHQMGSASYSNEPLRVELRALAVRCRTKLAGHVTWISQACARKLTISGCASRRQSSSFGLRRF